MSAKANYFKLGLFLIVAIALAVGAVLVFGAGRFFEKKIIMETYLDESVQGIDIGSKVKYRGVPIGNIRKIDFTRNTYQIDKGPNNQHSYVLLEIEVRAGPFRVASEEDVEKLLPREIERGLRARITAQGVTGTAYIEIDYLDPDKYPPLPIDWVPHHPYVPSAPSVLSRIVNSAEEVFAKLDGIDFERLANEAHDALFTLKYKLTELQFDQISTNSVGLLTEVRESNQRIQKLLASPEIQAALKDAAGAMAGLRRSAESPALSNSVVQFERTLRRIDQLVAGKDEDLQVTLDNLRALTENLREFSENAKRFPAQVLFGKPPQPSKSAP
jgi:phospholipid/cholesterol/gamma-HCH transport system substrate-binding protein